MCNNKHLSLNCLTEIGLQAYYSVGRRKVKIHGADIEKILEMTVVVAQYDTL
jgi:hypothetical protein